MVDFADSKERDRVVAALRQWFVSQGIENPKDQVGLACRLAARHIFASGPKKNALGSISKVEDIEKAEFGSLLEAAIQVGYYHKQANIVKKLIEADLQEICGEEKK